MEEERSHSWQPEADVDYGQKLIRHLIYKYRWLLIGLFVLGAFIAGIASLCQLPTYSANASIVVTKGDISLSSMARVPFFMGTNTAVQDEIQIIKSRELAQKVIAALALEVEVQDPSRTDMGWGKAKRLLRLGGSSTSSREQQFQRLTISDVQVSPDLLKENKLTLKATADGGWRIKDKSGAAGEPVELSYCRFTPVFGEAHRAPASYQLKIKPAYKALLEYNSALTVSTVTDSANVIRVNFAHDNPVICKRVVDLLLEEYFARYEDTMLGTYDTILAFVEEEITGAQQRVDQAMAELEEFREEHRIYEPSTQSSVAITSVAELAKSRAGLEIQRVYIEQLLSTMTARTPEQIYDSLVAPVTTLDIEQVLVEQLAGAINRRNQERLTKTGSHPDVQRVEEEIDTVVAQISDSLHGRLGFLKQNYDDLTRQINQYRGELRGLPAAESKVALLQSDIEVNQQILGLLKQNETETRLRRASTSTEIQPLDTAVLPAKPIKPRLSVNVPFGAAVGVFIAVLLGLILESSERRIGTLREIRLGLGLPVLSVLNGSRRRRPWRPADTHEEQFKRLAALLRTGHRAVGIVHVAGTPGGFDLAWGLSGAAGSAEESALLIDGDQLAASLTAALGKSREGAGLGEVLAGASDLDAALVPLGEGRVLLKPGKLPWSADKVQGVLSGLTQRFAAVLVCMPPPSQWVEQAALLKHLDVVMLSVPQRGADRREVAVAVEALRRHGVEPRGVVVTDFTIGRDTLGKSELRFVAVTPV